MIVKFKQFNESKLTNFINKVKSAKLFATDAHKGVKRRGGDDYIMHPDTVAKIVHRVKNSKEIASLIAAAYLHDVVEDTDTTIEGIRKQFGELVAELVAELTSDEEKIKLMGKEKYLTDQMLHMSSWGLVLKLADRLHNASDLNHLYFNGSEKDKEWAKKYASQTRHIINVLERERENYQKHNLSWYKRLKRRYKI